MLTGALRVLSTRADGGAVGITAFQSWRPEDSRVGVALRSEDGLLHVRSGGTTEVTATVRTTAPLTVRPELQLPAGDVAVILSPRSFAGSSPEDSVLVGLADGPDDLVLSWYNNSSHTSGVDVRVRGRDFGDGATGGCCASATWAPGDRFATVFGASTMTSWLEHDGKWRLLRTSPYGTAVTPEQRAAWSPAFGVRLTAGTLSVDRLTVLGRALS